MNEKQQILHIHGGSPWNTYEDYIKELQNKDIDPYAIFKRDRWHYNYYSFLKSDKYDVIKPDMPCKQNAHYNEWKIWFERHIEFMKDSIILVGHSLGGNFLAKYLGEEEFPISIKQLHLIASSHSAFGDDFKIKEFPRKLLAKDIPEIHIYHSTDDTIVPISESEKYHAALPGSYLHIFDDRFHFISETFPELFENIKNAK